MNGIAKKLVGLFVVAAAFPAPPLAAQPFDYRTTVTNTPNLLGYWPFTDATQANSSVNGYTGAFLGSAALGAAGSGPTLAADPNNKAVLLDGSGFVQTNLTGQVSNQGSLVGWFFPTILPSTAGRILYIAGESQFANNFDLQIDTDDHLKFYADTAGSSTNALTALTAADLNQWHFFAATFTSNTTNGATLYLDGVQVGQSTQGTHNLNTGQPFTMGVSNTFAGRAFQGRLDEIAIYNRALTTSEVSAIFVSTATPVPEPSTLSLGLAGLTGLAWVRRQRRTAGSTSRTTQTC
jgi:hypothetical protein